MRKKYAIEMEVSIDVPDNVPDCDVEDYIAFELGGICSISNDNAVFNDDESTDLSVTAFEIYEL